MAQPITTTLAHIVFVDAQGNSYEQPMELRLHSNLRRLLKLLEAIQARGRGDAVVYPEQPEDVTFAVLDNLPPAEVELCLVGAVGMACDICAKTGDELMILTSDEADWIRAERQRTQVRPLSDLRAQKGA